MAGGRPTKYSQALADKICARLAMGESMRSVSRDPAMPVPSTMFKWIRERPEFSKQYTKAKEESADALYEDLIDIADDGSNDWMEKNDPDNPGYQFNGEHYQRSRLRLDTRKWMASKMKPKKYGDRQALDVGGQKENPLTIFLESIDGKSEGLPNGNG